MAGGGAGSGSGDQGTTGRFKAWNRLHDQLRQRQQQSGAGGKGGKYAPLGGSGGAGGGDLNGDGELDAYERYWRAIKTLQPMERAVWLLVQGLLAGLCAAPAILQLCRAGDWQFITEYRRVANNLRRFIFILSTVRYRAD